MFEIYTSYIQKDIRFLFSIENIDKFNKVTKILASQIGSLMNISEISNTIGLSRLTVERYAFILESTFVLSFLLPHYSNVRKELSKMPKVYFEDVGLCNAISGKFAYEPDHFFWGQLAENFVFNQLQKRNDLEIKFWRNKNKQEVDFLVFKGDELIPIEVKFREQKVVRIPAGLRSFIREYHPARAIVVTRDFWDATQYNGTKILFLPIYLI